MRTRLILSLIVLAMFIPSIAGAAVTNRDLQLTGGVAVSNANDSFFFAPLEPGLTGRWGLYALSSAASGPIVETSSGYPARLLHADNEKVYFLAYSDPGRTIHALYEVDIAAKQISPDPLLSNIASAFVESDDSFLYVSTDDPYMLCRYSLKDKKATDLKSMASSKKMIYDAGVYDGKVYFITVTDSGSEDAYLLNTNGKANNLDVPSPKAFTSVLHEGYRVYSIDRQMSQIYAQKIGSKKSVRLAGDYSPTLYNYRFGNIIYAYDGVNNQLMGFPLDGSAAKTMRMDGSSPLSRLVMGGSKDEIYFYYSGGIYMANADLASQTKLFAVDAGRGGTTNLSYIAPLGQNALLVAGYNQATASNYYNLMPTNVYIYNRADGELLFGYPLNADEITENSGFQLGVDPIGDIPQPELGEGETAFLF